MFGYATNETDVLMPAPITLAHRLVKRQAQLRKSGKLSWLRPDAKSQVTLRYEDHKPVGLEAVVLSTQHSPDVSTRMLREAVMEEILKPILPAKWVDKRTKYHINSHWAFPWWTRRGRSETAGSRAARLSSTPTAATPVTAGVRSRARILPR